MSTSIEYPGARTQPGSPRALSTTAGAVIALSTAIAAAALVAGIVAGSAVEAPANPSDAQPAAGITDMN